MLPTLNGRIQTRVIVLGVGWELIYHLIRQFRWEKDWPTLFGLLTAVKEGALLWLLISLHAVPGAAAGGAAGGVPRTVPHHVDHRVAGGERADAGSVRALAVPRWEVDLT